jgi:pSer/pThr/pTyr-binding forkhead associated (FHA) protein
MAIRITIIDPADPGQERVRGFVLDRVVIGRAHHCDICLPDMAVSTRHLEIRREGTDYQAVDLGSLNGTWIGGRKLVAHRPKPLKNGDEINVAGYTLRFRLGVSPGPAEPRDMSIRQAREMLAGILARSGAGAPASALLVVAGPGPAARHELPEPPAGLLLGRGRNADIRLEDPDVAPEHAEIVVAGDGTVTVRDLGSRHGILFQGERVVSLTLGPGESFVAGGTALQLEHPLDGPLSEVLSAPEELTSSYSPLCEEPAQSDPDPEPSREPAPSSAEPPPPPPAPVPVGPADPLAYPGQPGYQRTTREIPRPDLGPGSDLGLILVGAIIVVAAVLALALLFT